MYTLNVVRDSANFNLMYRLFSIISEKFSKFQRMTDILQNKDHRNNRYRMRTWSQIMSPLFLMHALT